MQPSVVEIYDTVREFSLVRPMDQVPCTMVEHSKK